MKKLLRFLLKTIILILVIGFIFIQYLKSDFNNPFDQNRLSELKSQIKNTNYITSDFTKIYELVNPITDTNRILCDGLKEDYSRECPCLNVARMSSIFGQNRLFGNEYVLAWKLEKEFTQEECFNYYVRNYDFLYENDGIFEASEYYFNKKMSELDFDQKVTLALMLKNASLYNPKRNPDGIKKRIAEIKTKHNNMYN